MNNKDKELEDEIKKLTKEIKQVDVLLLDDKRISYLVMLAELKGRQESRQEMEDDFLKEHDYPIKCSCAKCKHYNKGFSDATNITRQEVLKDVEKMIDKSDYVDWIKIKLKQQLKELMEK